MEISRIWNYYNGLLYQLSHHEVQIYINHKLHAVTRRHSSPSRVARLTLPVWPQICNIILHLICYLQLLPLYVMDRLSHMKGLPGLFTACLFSGALRWAVLSLVGTQVYKPGSISTWCYSGHAFDFPCIYKLQNKKIFVSICILSCRV